MSYVSPSQRIADEVQKIVLEELMDAAGRPRPLYDLVINAAEKPLIETVLRRNGGKQRRTALDLGISYNTLRLKMLKHGIKR
jgi:DNA-binding protein Fis